MYLQSVIMNGCVVFFTAELGSQLFTSTLLLECRVILLCFTQPARDISTANPLCAPMLFPQVRPQKWNYRVKNKYHIFLQKPFAENNCPLVRSLNIVGFCRSFLSNRVEGKKINFELSNGINFRQAIIKVLVRSVSNASWGMPLSEGVEGMPSSINNSVAVLLIRSALHLRVRS